MSFSGSLLREVKKELEKHIPAEALKGIWTHGTSISKGNKNWEVQIPKNKWFPKGWYYHVGQADSAAHAKFKALSNMLDNLRTDKKSYVKEYGMKEVRAVLFGGKLYRVDRPKTWVGRTKEFKSQLEHVKKHKKDHMDLLVKRGKSEMKSNRKKGAKNEKEAEEMHNKYVKSIENALKYSAVCERLAKKYWFLKDNLKKSKDKKKDKEQMKKIKLALIKASEKIKAAYI